MTAILIKRCELSEFCSDLHASEKDRCEGRKNPNQCLAYLRKLNEDKSGIYGNPLQRR